MVSRFRSRHLLLLLSAALLVGVGAAVPAAAPANKPTRIELPKSVRVRVDGHIRSVPLEEYALVSALAEVSPVDESPEAVLRIFEVQTVLARTYAVANRGRHSREGFDLCDETHCQLYQPGRLATSRFVPAARVAASATKGRVLAFGSRVARALFHADCGGHTVAADKIWRGDALSYLIGAPDAAPDVAHRSWVFDVPTDALRAALNADRQTAVGRKLTSVVVSSRDDSGRAVTVSVDGSERHRLGGEKFRAVVNRAFGPKALQSTLFDITLTPGGFQFRGAGYGHGAGLCQVGAAARARRGQSLTEILAAYFPGARLV